MFPNTERGKQMMRYSLEGTKVLIILDDVSEKEQLAELMPPHDCDLGEGSQIVITTRDLQVLMWAQAQTCLPMEGLSRPLACELFNLHAFPLPEERDFQEEPSGDFKKLAEKVADACQGLPLALEVLGSYLHGKDISEWDTTVKVLESRIKLVDPQRQVTAILKISFDALRSEKQKEMFLDIACFLFREPKDKGMRIWRSEYGDAEAELHLKSLTRKCLVNLDKNGDLTMHNLLRDMGREIVDNSHKDYWERSHLWREEDVNGVLKKRKGTSHVRGLSSNVEKEWDTTSFASMDELKLLVLSNVTLTGDFSKIPQELRWFQLRNCPLRTPLPLNEIVLDNVAVLDLEGSQFTSFNYSGCMLQSLKELNLSNCSNLKELPLEFCKSSNSLEILILSGCVNLERMPDSELSSSLRYLDISRCSKLKALPNGITNLRALTTLLMNNCGGLTKLPDAITQLTALEKIGLDWVPLSTLPQPFDSFSNLVSLHLDHCSELRGLPSTMGNLKKLTSLEIISCTLISEIPQGITDLTNLVHFKVSDCESINQLPENIWNLWNLKEFHVFAINMKLSVSRLCQLKQLVSLELKGCNLGEDGLPTGGYSGLSYLKRITLADISMSSLPRDFGNLPNLEELTLMGCRNLSEVPCLPATLTSLDMGGCSNLERIPVSCLSSLRKLRSLVLCNCTQLVELHGLECLCLLSNLDIRGCRSLLDLPSGQLEKLTSLKSLYVAGSGVSILQENWSPLIQKMVSIEVANIMGDEVPDCFKESQGVYC